MPTVTRKVKGGEYLYFREWDTEKKQHHDIYLGQKESEEAQKKARELERQYILKQIRALRTKLNHLNGGSVATVHKPIDIKKLPLNKVINADAYDVLRQLPDNSIHMALTSPPYNLGVPYDAYVDEQEDDDYRKALKTVWNETFRILVPGGRFALNIASTGIADFRPIHHDLCNAVKEAGFTMRTEILWYKQNMGRHTAWGSYGSPSNPHVVPSWEYVYVFHKGDPKLEGNREDIDISPEEFQKFSDGFWEIPPETKRYNHPAPFPEELIYRLIKFYTYRGNIVLDMFAGVCTVGVVAVKTDRHYICIDISEQYCKTGKDRIKAALEQMVKKKELPLERFSEP